MQRTTYTDRYAQVQHELVPRIHERIAAASEAAAIRQDQLSAKLERRLIETIPSMRASEAASALRNTETAKAIDIDKTSLLRGKPTQITERRSPEEILRKLQALGLFDSDAEEIRKVS